MNTLTVILRAAFDWTWHTSLEASVLIVLVLVLQRLLRRWLTPRLRYVLSLLVLCRVLLPVAPPSSLSLENLLAQASRPAQSTPPPTIAIRPTTRGPARFVQARGLALGSALCIVWFCGLLILAGAAALRYHQWRRTIRAARLVSEVRMLGLLDNVRREMGIRRPVTLAALPRLGSPAVFGFWRFHLLLPETSLRFLSDEEWRLIFLHEMAHLRNHDTVLNAILIAVQFLHWFNPLVWIGLNRIRTDRELVCDAMVVQRLEPGERLGYAQVLLRLAEVISNGPPVFPSAVPVVSNAGEIKTRVLMIKHHRKASHRARAATAVCVLLLGFLTFTRAREGEAQIADGATAGLRSAGTQTAGEGANTVTATNGALVSYGPTMISADRLTTYPEERRVVAEGHVQVRQKEQDWSGERLDWNYADTNQAPSEQRVAAIDLRYVGPKPAQETAVRRSIHTRLGQAYTPAAIDDDVRSLYATGLFYNVHVSAHTSPKGIELIYSLQGNPRLAKVEFKGNTKFSDAQVQKLIRAKLGDVINERKAFADAQAIQTAYRNAGYKGTGVKYSYVLNEQTGEASVAFEITERP